MLVRVFHASRDTVCTTQTTLSTTEVHTTPLTSSMILQERNLFYRLQIENLLVFRLQIFREKMFHVRLISLPIIPCSNYPL